MKNPRVIVVLSLLFTLVTTWWALGLGLKNDFIDLLPKKMPEVKLLRTLIADMDGVGYESVIVTSPSKEKNRRYLKDLRQSLLKIFRDSSKTGLGAMQRDYERLGRLLRKSLQQGDSGTPQQRKNLELQIKNLHKERLVEYAYYRNRQGFFDKNQMYFLDVGDLKKLYLRMKKKFKYEYKKNMPGYIDLIGEKDPGLPTDDIQAKYKKKFKEVSTYIEVKDGKVFHTALVVRPLGPSSDFTFTDSFLKKLNKAIRAQKPKSYHKAMEVVHIGPYSKNLQEYHDASAELTQSFSLTFGLLVILLLVFFRRVRVIILLFVPLGMGTVWTFGLTWLTIGHFNTITGLTGALLLGLGIDYGIYLLDRYWNERRDGVDVEQAIQICFDSTGTAVATAGLTTAFGFFALQVCGFKGFSQFGFISGLGILMCLLAMSTVLPVLLLWTEARWPMKPPKGLSEDEVKTGVFPRSKTWVAVSVVVLCLVPVALQFTSFEYDIRELSYQKVRFKVQEERWKKLESKFIQSIKPVLYVLKTRKEVSDLTKELDKLKKRLGKQDAKKGEVIQAVYNAFRFVPTRQKEKRVWMDKMQKLFKQYNVDDYLDDLDEDKAKQFKKYRRRLKAQPFTIRDLPYQVQRDLVFYDKNDFRRIKGYLVIVSSTLNLFDAREAQTLRSHLQTVRLPQRKPVFSGEPITFAVVFEIIKVEGVIAVLASFLVVFLVVLLDLRDWKLTLLSLWPLLTGLLGMTLLLALLDIRLNFYNLIVLPALLGICVDAGVHIIHRYHERPDLGTRGVQQELFWPIALASLTTVISFASTIIARHAGIRSIGILAVVGLVSGLFSALFFLPALMQLIFQRFPIQPHDDDSRSETTP